MTLHAPYDPDNIFAKILRGEIPAVKVWEDDHVLAFMDVFPQSEGHVLVISKTSTRTWPSDCGKTSMKASTWSSSQTFTAGISPRRLLATMWSGS